MVAVVSLLEVSVPIPSPHPMAVCPSVPSAAQGWRGAAAGWGCGDAAKRDLGTNPMAPPPPHHTFTPSCSPRSSQPLIGVRLLMTPCIPLPARGHLQPGTAHRALGSSASPRPQSHSGAASPPKALHPLRKPPWSARVTINPPHIVTHVGSSLSFSRCGGGCGSTFEVWLLMGFFFLSDFLFQTDEFPPSPLTTDAGGGRARWRGGGDAAHGPSVGLRSTPCPPRRG